MARCRALVRLRTFRGRAHHAGAADFPIRRIDAGGTSRQGDPAAHDPGRYSPGRERRQGCGVYRAARFVGKFHGRSIARADCGAFRARLQCGRSRTVRALESAESKRAGRDRLAHDGAEYQSQSRLHESGHAGNARHAAPHRCVGSAGVRGSARHRWSGLRAGYFPAGGTAQSGRPELESQWTADARSAHCAAHRAGLVGPGFLS